MIRSAQAVFFHDGKALFHIFDLENDNRSLSGLVERRIQILDVDLVLFKKFENTGKAANAVRNGNRQYVSCLGGEFFLFSISIALGTESTMMRRIPKSAVSAIMRARRLMPPS